MKILLCRPLVIFLLCLFITSKGWSQCGTLINTFPYNEGFETSAAWTSGGTNSDWAWGAPSHPLINSAGGGAKCRCTGGLTGSFYNNGELSWLMSPCFDFTTLTYPWISFKIFWETEWKYDGMVLQYSLNGSSTWVNVGTDTDPVNCLNDNWYNYNSITGLSSANPKQGWTGRSGATAGACQGGHGSLGWVTAKHCMSALAGKPNVRFRFLFGAGTTCNGYDGIAIDDILIDNAAPNIASFTSLCTSSNTSVFTNTSAPCPSQYSWNFGDPGSGASNISSLQNPNHTYSAAGTYNVSLTASGPCNASGTVLVPLSMISVTAAGTNVTCFGANDGTASAAVTGGTGPYSYAWTPGGETAQTITGLSAETLTVTVSGTNTCASNAVVLISADTCPNDSIHIPNVFTPNGDGINDEFIIYTKGYKSTQCQIYNRWGILIYEIKNINEAWNGRTISGLKCSDGVYFFILKAEKLNGQLLNDKGFIQLINGR